MENTVVEEKKTVPEKVVAAPVEAGSAIVDGAETVGRDVAKGVSEVATVVADGTKTVVRVIIESGEQAGRDVKHVVSPEPEPVTIPAVAATPAA
jgi:hypothetical protein